jgi:hypothetical protein
MKRRFARYRSPSDGLPPMQSALAPETLLFEIGDLGE